MRKVLALILLLFINILPIFASSVVIYIVIKDKVNVRVDSTVSSLSLGYLSKGDLVEVLEEKFDWYKIRLAKEITCYVFSDYVELISAAKGQVKISQLNLRAEPSSESQVVGVLKEGDILEIVASGGEWLKVKGYPYAYGWMHKKFLQEYEPESDLVSLVKESIKKLSEFDLRKKTEIHQKLINKGSEIIPLIQEYISDSDRNTVYSLILILTQIGKDNPELAPYFLKKIDPSLIRTSSIYLDIAQGIINPQGSKVPYFYLAEEGQLSSADIRKAQSFLNAEYNQNMNCRNEQAVKTLE